MIEMNIKIHIIEKKLIINILWNIHDFFGGGGGVKNKPWISTENRGSFPKNLQTGESSKMQMFGVLLLIEVLLWNREFNAVFAMDASPSEESSALVWDS